MLRRVDRQENNGLVRSITFRDYSLKQETNEKEFEHLLLYTEVRGLSKEECISRFYFLFETIVEYIQENLELMQIVQARKSDIA